MEAANDKVKRNRYRDRVVLEVDSLMKIDDWINQVMQSAKGVLLTRKDMVNWIINSQEDVLAPNSINALKGKFFDEIRFLKQAIKEVKVAKTMGERINMEEVMNGKKLPNIKRRRPKKELGIDPALESKADLAVRDEEHN